MASGLDGDWQVVRAGGFLPPLVGVRKHIEGERGWTSLGPLPGAPFDVVGNELRYRAPFYGVVDVIEPSSEGFKGRATVFGREVGTFRLVRRR
ncbi:MAG TPA: hypothetical protein VGL76_02720 [Gaiellaceae bacterium]|jgi:hypothetical protein